MGYVLHRGYPVQQNKQGGNLLLSFISYGDIISRLLALFILKINPLQFSHLNLQFCKSGECKCHCPHPTG